MECRHVADDRNALGNQHGIEHALRVDVQSTGGFVKHLGQGLGLIGFRGSRFRVQLGILATGLEAQIPMP